MSERDCADRRTRHVGSADAGRRARGAAADAVQEVRPRQIRIRVFDTFVLAPDRMLQQFGLGLAVAILIDAFVIRSLVVPAVMQLLGTRAWWLPTALGRRLPRLAIEPHDAARERA